MVMSRVLQFENRPVGLSDRFVIGRSAAARPIDDLPNCCVGSADRVSKACRQAPKFFLLRKAAVNRDTGFILTGTLCYEVK